MTGYKLVNLKMLVDAMGENKAKEILSHFSCPLNPDVNDFLHRKAIEFSMHGWAQTHLVFASYKDAPVLVGYFSLANKQIVVSDSKHHSLGQTLKKRIREFSTFDDRTRSYYLSAPLLAQLGKNFANGYNNLITADELLKLACDKIQEVQLAVGGRFAYVECEDKPKLVQFYTRNGFVEFDRRELDRDEVSTLDGEYLIQLLRKFK